MSCFVLYKDDSPYTFIISDNVAPSSELQDKTATISGFGSSVNVPSVELGHLPGAVISGVPRIESSKLTLTYSDTENGTTPDLRARIRKVHEVATKADWLMNDDTQMQTKISLSAFKVSFLEGSLFQHAEVEMTFVQLTPYWESVTELSEVVTISTPSNEVIVPIEWNESTMDTPMDFYLTISSGTTLLLCTLEGNTSDAILSGIVIGRIAKFFGSSATAQVIIYNTEGSIKDGYGVDFTKEILLGTGFFNTPPESEPIVGSPFYSLVFRTHGGGTISALTIKYRKREVL